MCRTQVELFYHLPRIHRQNPICFPKCKEEQSLHDANIVVGGGSEEYEKSIHVFFRKVINALAFKLVKNEETCCTLSFVGYWRRLDFSTLADAKANSQKWRRKLPRIDYPQV